jgi:hypothetical protein
MGFAMPERTKKFYDKSLPVLDLNKRALTAFFALIPSNAVGLKISDDDQRYASLDDFQQNAPDYLNDLKVSFEVDNSEVSIGLRRYGSVRVYSMTPHIATSLRDLFFNELVKSRRFWPEFFINGRAMITSVVLSTALAIILGIKFGTEYTIGGLLLYFLLAVLDFYISRRAKTNIRPHDASVSALTKEWRDFWWRVASTVVGGAILAGGGFYLGANFGNGPKATLLESVEKAQPAIPPATHQK